MNPLFYLLPVIASALIFSPIVAMAQNATGNLTSEQLTAIQNGVSQPQTISQQLSAKGFHFVGNYTILHETDKSIVLSTPDPTWANLDEWVLRTQLGMTTVSKVNQGNVMFGSGGGSVILTMTMLP